LRVAVFTDHEYTVRAGVVYGDRAYVQFLTALAPHLDRLVLLGRLDPSGTRARYPLPPGVVLAALPHYESLMRPGQVAAGFAAAVRRFARVVDGVDLVWLHGPHHLALAFAALARVRGRPIALAVRQDLPAYVRSRHPGRRGAALAADALERAWRLLAATTPVVAVGPQLAAAYAHAPDLIELTVTTVREADLAAPPARDYAGDLVALSVGRLEAEKNPLLLADALALLRRRDPRWRLVVVGEGALAGDLRRRLQELGVAAHADLRGYVAPDQGLMDVYRSSHAFLHVSWTEGMPQVLIEAFAARLPVVATAVGGVPAVARGAALLVPPGDADAAADALARLAGDEDLRARLVTAGAERARAHTIEAESARLAAFLRRAAGRAG
jgi:glycosyltransferase involved in cell wall biosynthesis